MTIIIGASAEPAAPNPLSQADVDFPHPASVPADQRVLSTEQIIELLGHELALVRSFAIEQVANDSVPELIEALVPLLRDEDDAVAAEAVAVLDKERYHAATEAVRTAFAESKGARTVALAGALATLAPDTLLEAVQAKGRIDTEAYGAVLSALAITASEPVIRFFDKALNRSGALTAERRSALFTAVLLAGDPALATRVLTKAVSDSKQEEPESASFPSRVALGTIAGIPLASTRTEAGDELFKQVRAQAEAELPGILPAERLTALDEALRGQKIADVFVQLRALLEQTDVDATPADDLSDIEKDTQALARRRHGLLRALIERAEDIAKLEAAQAALFIATAMRAALTAASLRIDEAKSAGMVALSKGLEVDVAELAAEDETALTTRFKARSARDIRRVVTAVVRESFFKPDTLERMVHALVDADHGRALLEAVSEVKEDTGVHQFVMQAMAERRETAEAIVVDVLSETPLPEDLVNMALILAAMVRTEKVGVAIGRRYYDLRNMARHLTAQAVFRVADARSIPLLESRAFVDEPEELAWTLLALIHGQPKTPQMDKALARFDKDRSDEEQDADAQDRPQLTVTLECEVCGETLRYRFDHAYVDTEDKDNFGDPAFVGPIVCKACNTPDRLKPTMTTATILTEHMMAYLQAMSEGFDRRVEPLVSPARTTVGGKQMGMAAALRALNKEVEERPQSIRARLHRGKIRMLLKRDGVEEDIDAIKAIDADSAEADALRVSYKMRKGDDDDGAAQLAIGLLKRIKQEPEPRLYDTDDIEEIRDVLERQLLELSDKGQTLPDEIDLSSARKRRQRMIDDLRAMAEEEEEKKYLAQNQPPAAKENKPAKGSAASSSGRRSGRRRKS